MFNTLLLLVTQQMMQSLRWRKDFKCSQVVAVAAKKSVQVRLDSQSVSSGFEYQSHTCSGQQSIQ